MGVPAVFVRLGGCNLACDFCDTDFEDFTEMAADKVVGEVECLAKDVIKLVVITGGEPLRQNIAPLCEMLLEKGLDVQIETNGTLYRELPEKVHIICSPKNTGQGYHTIREDLLPHIDAFKFIVSAKHDDYQDISIVGQEKYHTPVYVQPMDEGDEAANSQNRVHAVALCQKHGYRLSLQTHKILGIA